MQHQGRDVELREVLGEVHCHLLGQSLCPAQVIARPGVLGSGSSRDGTGRRCGGASPRGAHAGGIFPQPACWHCRARAGHGARPCRPAPAAGAGLGDRAELACPGDGLGAVGGAEFAHQVAAVHFRLCRGRLPAPRRCAGSGCPRPAAPAPPARGRSVVRPGPAPLRRRLARRLACCRCRRMPAAPGPGSRAGCRGRRRGLPYGPRPAGPAARSSACPRGRTPGHSPTGWPRRAPGQGVGRRALLPAGRQRQRPQRLNLR